MFYRAILHAGLVLSLAATAAGAPAYAEAAKAGEPGGKGAPGYAAAANAEQLGARTSADAKPAGGAAAATQTQPHASRDDPLSPTADGLFDFNTMEYTGSWL